MGACLGSQRYEDTNLPYRSTLAGSHVRPATVFPGQDPYSYRTNGVLPFPEGLFIDGVNHRRILTRQTPKISNTQTMKSFVNLKKHSLKLVKESEGSSKYKISFLADSIVPCKVFIYVMAYDKDHVRMDNPPKLKSQLTKRYPSLSGELSGLNQAYSGSFETDLCFDGYSKEELTAKNTPSGTPFPIVIRLQTQNAEDVNQDSATNTHYSRSSSSNNMQAQTTYCTLVKQADGSLEVKVVKQVLWVEGVSYLLKEIFGLDKGDGENNDEDRSRSKECVVCMAETRDTLALPCRHLCLCIDCAESLRYRTNKCPICRSVIQSLLQITTCPNSDEFTPTVTVPMPSSSLHDCEKSKNESHCSMMPPDTNSMLNECAID